MIATREPSPVAASRTMTSAAEAARRARALAPGFRERAAQTEADRRVPADSIRELHASGLFGLLTPKRFGGSELGMEAVVAATIEIAAGCASTGWVYGVLTGHAYLVAKLPLEAQAEVFADPDALIAALIRIGGEAPQRVPGGYRWVGGRGKFCSGIDHSGWVLLGGQVREGDRNVQRYFLLPREDVDIVDDWYTVGLRGTGSKSIVVRDAFIPDHRSVTFDEMLDGSAPGGVAHGTFYQLPFQLVWPMSLPGTTVGVAKAALATYTEKVRESVAGNDPVGIAEQSAAFVRIGEAAARIRAAELVLLENARTLATYASLDDLPADVRATCRRDTTYAVQESRRAVNVLFEAAGGSGVYDTGALQRLFRDANASASHVGFTWDTSMAGYGRSALGLPPQRERIGR